MPHVPGLDCYAYRVESDAGTMACSGDTMMCDALAPIAEGADVFVVECSCWGENCGPHLNPNDILALRKQISPSTKFVLTHIGGGEAPKAIMDAGILADDFERMTIGGSHVG